MKTLFLIGNLTKDVELRHTTKGTAVCDINIAVNGFDGKEKTTDYFRVTAWGKEAESCGQYLKKGKKVHIEADVRNDKPYEKEGVKIYGDSYTSRKVTFL